MFIFVTEWFSNSANHNFKVDKAMTKVNAVFRVCGGCANKNNDVSLQEGAFRCPLVAHIIGSDIVWYDTDATDCVREGCYRCLSDGNADVELCKDINYD